MKKIFAIAAACAALVGCVKNDVDFSGNYAQGERIDFATVSGLQTDGRAAYTSHNHFVAAAFLLNEGETWAGVHTTAAQYFANERVEQRSLGGETVWTTSTAYYWPAKGSLTFFAYAPEGISATRTWDANRNYVFADFSVETNKNIDFMVADIVKEAKGNPVNTVFRHKLTQIKVGITKAADDVRDITLTQVKLNGVYHTGTYTMPYNHVPGTTGVNDYWTVAAGPSSESCVLFDGITDPADAITVTDVTTAVPLDHIYVIPQAFTSASQLEVTYTVESGSATETVNVKISLHDLDSVDQRWSINELISYNLTIGDVEQIIWAPTEEGWDESSENSYTIEI